MHRSIRFIYFTSPFTLLLLAPDVMALETVCVNSPENPTIILGLIGAAVAAYPMARGRLQAVFKHKDRAAHQEEGRA